MEIVFSTTKGDDQGQQVRVIIRTSPKLEPNLRSSYLFESKYPKVSNEQEREFARSFSSYK